MRSTRWAYCVSPIASAPAASQASFIASATEFAPLSAMGTWSWLPPLVGRAVSEAG